MKLSDIKKHARLAQERVAASACAEYYEEYGTISDDTIDTLNQLCYNLQLRDRDEAMSVIVFSEEQYANKVG